MAACCPCRRPIVSLLPFNGSPSVRWGLDSPRNYVAVVFKEHTPSRPMSNVLGNFFCQLCDQCAPILGSLLPLAFGYTRERKKIPNKLPIFQPTKMTWSNRPIVNGKREVIWFCFLCFCSLGRIRGAVSGNWNKLPSPVVHIQMCSSECPITCINEHPDKDYSTISSSASLHMWCDVVASEYILGISIIFDWGSNRAAIGLLSKWTVDSVSSGINVLVDEYNFFGGQFALNVVNKLICHYTA